MRNFLAITILPFKLISKHQPFTPVSCTPSMIFFWKIRKMMIMGMVATEAPVMISSHWLAFSAENCARPSVMVYFLYCPMR